MGRVEAHKRVPVERLHAARVAGDGVAVGMAVAVHVRGERAGREHGGLVAVLQQSEQPLALLARELVRREGRLGHDLRQQRERRLEVRRQDLQRDHGLIPVRADGEVRAERLEQRRDVERGAEPGALVDHFGREAGPATHAVRVRGGARADHEAGGDERQRVHRRVGHLEPAGHCEPLEGRQLRLDGQRQRGRARAVAERPVHGFRAGITSRTAAGRSRCVRTAVATSAGSTAR